MGADGYQTSLPSLVRQVAEPKVAADLDEASWHPEEESGIGVEAKGLDK